MIHKILYSLTANLPCRLIDLPTGPYLERYYLGRVCGVTFYLHRFVSSDSERHLHNHPWTWGRSLILSGGYVEERATDICPHASASGCVTHQRRIRWWNRVNAATFHQIHAAKPNTWSLFFHGPRATVMRNGRRAYKGWGFIQRQDLPDGEKVTAFFPFPSSTSKWWLTAPDGRSAGRFIR